MVAMYLIVGLETIFNIKFVAMFIIYLSAKFHVPNCNGSLITAVKLIAIYRFHVVSHALS
jgi:hypothetical protein